MILVTSANGRTGRAVVGALLAQKQDVKAFDISPAVAHLKDLGVKAAIVGDLLDRTALSEAMDGVRAVVHIGPPFHPKERFMGETVIDAAKAHGVEHFVYFSVVHPQIEALMQHKMKLMVEQHLINSRLPYTILQPMIFMQNVNVRDVVERRVFDAPWSVQIPLSFVDMDNVAEVAAKVVTEGGHLRATYELCGSDLLSSLDIARIISEESGEKVKAEAIPPDVFIAQFTSKVSDDYSIDAKWRLVSYYNRYGLSGNPNVLAWLLGRAPTSFAEYVRRGLRKDPACSSEG